MFYKRIFLLVVFLISIFTLTSCELVTVSSGESAYDIAVRNGFQGSETEWLESLKGEKGDKGDSLKITEIYDEAVKSGYSGTFLEFLDFFSDTDIVGKSAYEVALENGFTGTEEEWLASLKGDRGSDGEPGNTIDLYDIYTKLVELGLANEYANYEEFAEHYITELELDTSTVADSTKIINQALRSSVQVICTSFDYLSDEYESYIESGSASGSSGSGIIFKLNKEAGDAYIITNYHVIYNEDANDVMKYIYVFLYGNRYTDGAMRAEFIGGSATYDVAVIKLTNETMISEGICEAVSFADSNEVLVGSKVYAIGNANGEGISVTEGIVSVDSETIDLSAIKSGVTLNSKGYVDTRVIRIDAAINSGNSGGGVFNSDGKLIGIVNAKNFESDIENMGYAIPANIVYNVANKIYEECDGKTNTTFTRCLMGITITINSVKATLDENGNTRIVEEVIVHEVSETGLANGVVFKDDIIKTLTLNGKTYDVNRTFVLVDACLQAKVGDTASLVILRGEEEITVNLTFTTKVDVV